MIDFIQENSELEGDCDFCEEKSVALINVASLCPYFRNLISDFRSIVYDSNLLPGEDIFRVGEPLLFLIQDRWQVFNETVCESGAADDLLEAIVNSDWDDDSGEAPIETQNLYTNRPRHWASSSAQDWEEFSERVKREPELEPPLSEMLAEDISQVEMIVPPGTTFHRARPGWDPTSSSDSKAAYQGPDIGAPPLSCVREGRANSSQERVLYVSEQEETAIAETRPPRGSIVSVSEMRTLIALRILNLGDPIQRPNPFTTAQLPFWVEHSDLLAAFAWSLERPLERTDDPSDYLASQKFCRQVKTWGFEGIRYPSAMNPNGINVVIFDAEALTPVSSRLVTMTHISFSYKDNDDYLNLTLKEIR